MGNVLGVLELLGCLDVEIMTLSGRVCRVDEDCEECNHGDEDTIRKVAIRQAREQYFLTQ